MPAGEEDGPDGYQLDPELAHLVMQVAQSRCASRTPLRLVIVDLTIPCAVERGAEGEEAEAGPLTQQEVALFKHTVACLIACTRH